MGAVRVRRIRRAAWVVCLLPALWLGALAATNNLGADPIGLLTNRTGLWSLQLLLLALAITPAYRWLHWTLLPPLRRVFGLASFYYACAHLAVYLGLNQYARPGLVIQDLRHPYILVGYLSWGLAIPLALTSTDTAMRRLGARWKRLHRLVYAVAIAAVLHYALLLKIDFHPAIRYSLTLAVLLGLRWVKPRARRPAPPSDPAPAGPA